MKKSAQPYQYKTSQASSTLSEVKSLRQQVKELDDMIERLGWIANDARYRRLQRFELMHEIIEDYLESENDDGE